MQRVGFIIRVRPERIEEYKKHHQEVWPEMLAELKAAGMSNYSLWLSPDGLEFGYVECADWQAACRYLEASEINAKWQNFMSEYLISSVDEKTAQPISLLEEVFYLT